MPAPRRLPRDAIYQGLDGLAVLQQVAAKALAWAEDAALCTMFPMDQRAELEPDTGLEIVRVSAWVIRFVSPARGTSRAYRVTADAVEELETSADVPDCRPIGMPRIGNHEALDLASRNLLVCGNWNASRIEQVRPDMKAPRLRQMQVDGQWTFVWYLPYLGPDAVPIIVDALTGDRVRMADGAFKRFRWEVE